MKCQSAVFVAHLLSVILLAAGCSDSSADPATGGSGGSGSGGTGGAQQAECGLGVACSDDSEADTFCNAKCGSRENRAFAYCNNESFNAFADGDVICACETGPCSACEPSDDECDSDAPDGGQATCDSVCAGLCGGLDQVRDASCVAATVDTEECACVCANGVVDCFEPFGF